MGEQRGHLRADQHVVRQTEDGEITTKLREEKVERDCERGGEDAGGLTPPTPPPPSCNPVFDPALHLAPPQETTPV